VRVTPQGHVVLIRFPRTDLGSGKLRPALVVKSVPGRHDDWLLCMISSNMAQIVSGFDDVISSGDEDYEESGLRTASVVRVGRLAVVARARLHGSIGVVAEKRVNRIRRNLVDWHSGA